METLDEHVPAGVRDLLAPLATSRPDIIATASRLMNDMRVLAAHRYDLPYAIISELGVDVSDDERKRAKIALKLLKHTSPGEASTARQAAEALLAHYFTKGIDHV
jgi:hypothetical protein